MKKIFIAICAFLFVISMFSSCGMNKQICPAYVNVDQTPVNTEKAQATVVNSPSQHKVLAN